MNNFKSLYDKYCNSGITSLTKSELMELAMGLLVNTSNIPTKHKSEINRYFNADMRTMMGGHTKWVK